MAAVTGAPPAIVAEAGSREAPPLPPGLLTDMGEAGGRPTKLFIGGISRHTTTKQLRDHFSQFGRVLDCVAMRQPDGRPRGFGYVTLDSPTAADQCLAEPQMIDNRIVDMKLAVPEGTCSGSTSPTDAGFNPKMFGRQGAGGMDFYNGVLSGQGYNGWETSGAYYNPSLMWGNGGKATQGLDCADLLTAARELAISHAPPPHGLLLQSVDPREYGDFSAIEAMSYGNDSMLIPEEFQKPAGAMKMSANAPEFVPLGAQAPQPPTSDAVERVGVTPQQKSRNRAPFGELTNLVAAEVGDLLKPFESPTNKLAGMGHGHLVNQSDGPVHSTGLLLDDEAADTDSPSSSSDTPFSPDTYSPDMTSPESAEPKVEVSTEESPDERSPDSSADVVEDSSKPEDSLRCLPEEDDAASEGSDGSNEEAEPVVVDQDNLPSMGSSQHATGECKRCNFYPKGRCQNGKNCTFCHFPHDKRKPSRQEKRERRSAWLEQQDPPAGLCSELGLQEAAMQFPCGPLLSNKHLLQQGGFPVYADEDMFSCETLAYSIFPGMPPIHATKLPAPLPLPGMDAYLHGTDMGRQQGPALPPGLAAPPALSTQPWQPEAEVSPAVHQLRSMGLSTMTGNSIFSTVPTPLRTPATTAASTPMPTPVPTPTAAMTRTAAEAGSLLTFATSTMCTSGTQTGDWMCNKCEEDLEGDSISTANVKTGHRWSREELLRLRDGLAKMPQASETGQANLLPHTRASAACPSI